MIRSIGLVVSLLVTSLFLLSGCGSLRREVDPDRLNREAAKLVVTCFLSPQDTVLAVKITRSQPVLGEEIRYPYNGTNVSNATVALGVSGKSVMLRYDSQLGYYGVNSQQLPIVTGQTYTLSVQTPAGEQATSTCTIPVPVNLTSVTFDTLTDNQSGGQYRNKRYYVIGRWQDLAGQANFYQVKGELRYIPQCTGCQTNPNYKETEQNSTLYFNDNSNGLQTDRGKEGKEMISDRAFVGSYYFGSTPQSGFGSQYKSATLTINLLNTDQAYYQYQDAVARQSQSSDNPFAEPVPVPSNIQGGLGCFAGYNRSTMTLKLK